MMGSAPYDWWKLPVQFQAISQQRSQTPSTSHQWAAFVFAIMCDVFIWLQHGQVRAIFADSNLLRMADEKGRSSTIHENRTEDPIIKPLSTTPGRFVPDTNVAERDATISYATVSASMTNVKEVHL